MNRITTHSRAIVARACLLLLLVLAAALQPALAETVERVVYYHQNLQGSTVAATDETGSVLWREAYSPHGERLLNADDDDNEIWYTGKPHDQSLGLTYMGARWYDPVLGRFTGVDPVEFEESNLALFNRYAYGNNSPYTYSDPTGEFPVPVLAVVWGVGAAMTAYDTYRTYQREGAAAAAATLARDAAITAVAGPVAARAVRLGGVGRVVDRTALAARHGTSAERTQLLERVLTADGGLNASQTVTRQLAGSRSYIPHQSVLDTIGSGTRAADPQGVAGQFMYRAPAQFNRSSGTLEALVHEPSGQVRHVLFRSGQ